MKTFNRLKVFLSDFCQRFITWTVLIIWLIAVATIAAPIHIVATLVIYVERGLCTIVIKSADACKEFIEKRL